jgi:hypothetical protein
VMILFSWSLRSLASMAAATASSKAASASAASPPPDAHSTAMAASPLISWARLQPFISCRSVGRLYA